MRSHPRAQARAVVDGLPGDIVALALPLDVMKIAESGLINADWQACRQRCLRRWLPGCKNHIPSALTRNGLSGCINHMSPALSWSGPSGCRSHPGCASSHVATGCSLAVQNPVTCDTDCSRA